MPLRRYTISDGDFTLTLDEVDEGGFMVTSPFDPELVTQAETVHEAFTNARDAAEALAASRAKFFQQLQRAE